MTENPRLERRAEFDKNGERTGYEYWICTGCGTDAMWRDAVRDHCDCEATPEV